VRPVEREPARQPPPEPAYAAPVPAPQVAPPQVAAVPRLAPAAPPAPVISAGYRAMLSAWLESHKRYPESAREHDEQGQAVLRFRVDRSGRVLDYAVVGSTGYADLDAALDAMMRGAVLPAFPAAMTATNIEVSVTIRFGLRR
jgi:protein TonB